MKKANCVRCKVYKKGDQGLLVQQGMQAHEDPEVQGDVKDNENIRGYQQQQQQFLQSSTTNILPNMITSFPNPLPFQMSNYNNPSSSFSFGLRENHGYQQQHFLQPSCSNRILPDMITSFPNPLPFQMSNHNNPSSSFSFSQQDLGMNSSFLSEFDPYKFETNITRPLRIVNIPDELSVALDGFLNPIRGADMEASSSIPDHAKGSDQLEAPSYTAPTQHISMENQGNLQDSSPQLSRKRDYNRNMVNNDPSTQLTGSAHPRPMKRTRLMD